MKTVLLAGGMGTRISEHTDTKPKPMIEIGGRPMLWHLMRYFAHYGHTEFVVALGYLSDYVKTWFLEYQRVAGSMTLKLRSGLVDAYPQDQPEDWTVHLIDTGMQTMTGGRVRRVKDLLSSERFLLTYGDGLSDIDLDALLAFHASHGRTATITAVRPPARFGGIVFEGDRVAEFTEKPQIGEGWINGGFMVFEPTVLDLIPSDATVLERDVLEKLARKGELMAFRHEGFWQCMDTVRDLKLLESRWQAHDAPWQR